jgi:hypothetical protein
MKRIRVQGRRTRRDRGEIGVLPLDPLDPRDPDVVRVKALSRGGGLDRAAGVDGQGERAAGLASQPGGTPVSWRLLR